MSEDLKGQGVDLAPLSMSGIDVPEKTEEEVVSQAEPELEVSDNDLAEGDEVVAQQEEVKEKVYRPKEDINFVALRKAREAAEKERDEYRKKYEFMEKAYNQQTGELPKSPATKESVPDVDMELDPDSLVEGKHISKVTSKIKKLEQKLAEQEYRASQNQTEMAIKAKYPDFDSVVSAKNIEALNLVYPEIANSLAQSPDLYNKACAAYTLIKKFGINMDNKFEAEEAKISKNTAKPRASAGKASSSPLTHASSFSDVSSEEQRAAIYKEMLELSQG